MGVVLGALLEGRKEAGAVGIFALVWRPSKLVMADWLLAVVLSGLTLATLFSQTPGHVGWNAAVVSVLTIAPIALRQSYPVWTMTVILAAITVISLMTRGDLPGSGVGIVVAMFTVGMLRARSAW